MAHSVRRTLAALVLLGVAVAILASLGAWQLRRADERRAILAAIQAGRAQPPLALAPATAPAELGAWRPARANGQWLAQYSVLLQNRNQEGRPGYWLATPLLLDPARHSAVLVLRGWLPRAEPGQASPPLPATPDGQHGITGELSPRVPRLFELWALGGSQQGQLPATLPVAGGVVPQVQNLELSAYAQATGLTLLPTVLMQTRGDDGLVRDWPQPSVDYDQNQGYALQWFSFAAIAAIAWLVVAWRGLRRSRPAG
ncbi:SURF1 family protein [Bordetella sp. BOR01]|uniref:SURF1 family protein n=1 Tax=Bordetella sp. BOR01 TaxID=2854779 RepID=UPI001C451951|nr:SURF1 family protein [Bordetella sp. BOR01]MBV7484929.1 SURF1 family protein [Bordetella sp. BOR01]